tara:strand:+ start:371 stop:553 length:183 start_codon:yes stop_codon:yes gene_type:complete
MNIDFLTSGKQFVNKLNENKTKNTNINEHNIKCAWSVKNLKSSNFYTIEKQVKNYKESEQ